MNQSLVDLLRKGGYILYTRHGEANVGDDLPNLNFYNCYTQRNLSDNGRKQAISYGEALRNLQIPIHYPVIVSPLCRAIESALLAFGRGRVMADPFWFDVFRLSSNLSETEQKRILANLNSVLEITPPPGQNTVIIAHGFPEGVGLGQISDMGTVVIRPLGRGNGYEVVGRLTLEELKGLAQG